MSKGATNFRSLLGAPPWAISTTGGTVAVGIGNYFED